MLQGHKKCGCGKNPEQSIQNHPPSWLPRPLAMEQGGPGVMSPSTGQSPAATFSSNSATCCDIPSWWFRGIDVLPYPNSMGPSTLADWDEWGPKAAFSGLEHLHSAKPSYLYAQIGHAVHSVIKESTILYVLAGRAGCYAQELGAHHKIDIFLVKVRQQRNVKHIEDYYIQESKAYPRNWEMHLLW